MADGHIGASRSPWLWTELFRTFQVALDPKKLLLAAMGLVAAAVATKIVSVVFFAVRSEPVAANYDPAPYIKKGESEESAKRRAADAFARDFASYQFVYRLAGPGDPTSSLDWKKSPGSYRSMPWHEDRGPNPFLMITGQAGDSSGSRAVLRWLAGEGLPVLIEPLVKFLKPVTLLLNPRADFATRLYLLVVAFITLAVWAYFGGAITRIAVLQLGGKEPPSLAEALRFVTQKYVHYLAAPLVPLFFVAGIVVVTMIFGFIHLIPYLGDLINGVLWPIPLLLGFAQALLLVGLVGYPLMFATISAEGTDTFDALSRSYNYVYQSPWHYICYSLVALAYGMVVVFFVGFMGSFVVYLSKWAISQTPGTEAFVGRRIDHLFMNAPTTFGWQDLLVDRPELKSNATPEVRAAYLAEYVGAGNYLSAWMVGLWTTLVLLFVVGYGYSYFFCASTVVYLLMRAHVDDTELDEVFVEDDVPDEPLLPPTTLPGPGSNAGPTVQMVDPPTLRTPPAAEPPAAPPAGP